jgi:hypothetical protein
MVSVSICEPNRRYWRDQINSIVIVQEESRMQSLCARLVKYLAHGVLALPLVASCGGDIEPGAPNEVMVSAGEAMERSIKTLCSKAHECRSSFSGSAQMFEEAYGADEAACVMTYIALSDPDGLQASVDASRATYNADAADKCNEFYANQTCAQVFDETATPPAACEDVYSGTAADGAACTHTVDCVNPNAYCDSMTSKCTPAM